MFTCILLFNVAAYFQCTMLIPFPLFSVQPCAPDPRMFFGRGLLDIYNAAMNLPCEIADTFDEEVAARLMRYFLCMSTRVQLNDFNSLLESSWLCATLHSKDHYFASPCFVWLAFNQHEIWWVSQEQRVSCMISVSGMITTFDYVAALLALVVSECPEGANIKAGVGWLQRWERLCCYRRPFLWSAGDGENALVTTENARHCKTHKILCKWYFDVFRSEGDKLIEAPSSVAF